MAYPAGFGRRQVRKLTRPLYSVAKAYTLDGIDPFDGFESTSGWTATTATVTQDNTHAIYGNALKIVNTANTATIEKTITAVATPTGMFRLHVWVDDVTKLSSPALYFRVNSTTNFSKYAEKRSNRNNFINGWNWIEIPLSEFTLNGGESWSNNRVQISILWAYNSGQTTNIWLDTLQYIESTRPKVVLTFDDGLTSLYNYAIPSLDNHQLRATFYMPPTAVGSGVSYFSLAQMIALSDRGYGFGGHAYDHVNLSTLADAAAVQANLEQMVDWFETNGLTKDNQHLHLAYPYGGYNQAAVDGAAAAGIKTARITGIGYKFPFFDTAQNSAVVGKALTMPIGYALDATGTYAGAVAAIQAAMAVKASIILMGHEIVSGTPTGNQFSASEFELLCAWLYDQRNTLDVETVAQFYNGFSAAQII